MNNASFSGPYLLTTRLIKVLEKSPSPRVVSLSSAGILLTKLDPDILNFGSGESLSYTYLTQHKVSCVCVCVCVCQRLIFARSDN